MKSLIKGGLSGNQLKILAVIFMTIDHIGVHLFPGVSIFRVVGRLAFPIFAYTFAEGCKYTKNRKRHFLVLCLVAVLCQIFYTLATSSLYQNILVTLALSASLIYSMDFASRKKTAPAYIFTAAVFLGVFFISYLLPRFIPSLGFSVDYGFFGVMLPVLVYFGKTKDEKLFMLSAGLLILATGFRTRQLFSLLAVPIIALYNGQRGKLKMKNFFYIYYPLHLVIIYFIRIFLG